MSIFEWLDNKLFAIPKAWISAFNDDEELAKDNNEKALRMSQAVSVTRDAGLSMFYWTIGFVVVAPLVVLSLPAAWPLWVTMGIGLMAIGVTEALLSLATNIYLNRNEIGIRWKSAWQNSQGVSGKASAASQIAFKCVITIIAAMLWGMAAPFGHVGGFLAKLIPQSAREPIQIAAASFAYAMPGLVSIFRT